MAVAYTATIKGFAFGFDFEDERIDIDAAIDRLSVIDVYDAIKLAQSSEVGIAYPEIATASGLDALSLDILTYITVKLLSSWEINTLKVTGKFEVSAGNLIRADNQDPFRDNPLITYINYISQAGVVASVSTGSGLSSEEHNKLMATANETSISALSILVSAGQALALTAAQAKKWMFNHVVNLTEGQLIKRFRVDDEFNVVVSHDGNQIPSTQIEVGP